MNSMNPCPPERLDILDDWNEPLAISLAAEEQIAMSDAHWDVVHFIRHHCQQNGQNYNARLLLKLLSRHFAHHGGKPYIYALFPSNPAVQACKIAGIPLPSNPLNPPFGKVH